jgi:hypothetical protein
LLDVSRYKALRMKRLKESNLVKTSSFLAKWMAPNRITPPHSVQHMFGTWTNQVWGKLR